MESLGVRASVAVNDIRFLIRLLDPRHANEALDLVTPFFTLRYPQVTTLRLARPATPPDHVTGDRYITGFLVCVGYY